MLNKHVNFPASKIPFLQGKSLWFQKNHLGKVSHFVEVYLPLSKGSIGFGMTVTLKSFGSLKVYRHYYDRLFLIYYYGHRSASRIEANSFLEREIVH